MKITNRHKLNALFLFVVIPVCIGTFIYIAWGVQTLLVFNWTNFGIANDLINFIRQITIPLKSYVPNFVIYNLPDGIWVFSVTSFMLIIWDGEIHKKNLLWVSSGLILGLGSEIGQHPKISLVPGTFDYWDILFYVAGFILAFVLLKNN